MLSLQRLVKPALCLLLGAGPALAQEQPRACQAGQMAAMSNQQMAEVIAQKMQMSGQLKDYHIDVLCQSGVVELSGVVSDMGQRSMAARMACQVPGVVKVVNHVAVKRGEVVQTKFDGDDVISVPPASAPEAPAADLHAGDPQLLGQSAMMAQAAPARETLPAPASTEPMPSFRAAMPAGPGGPGVAALPPPMPPYAWPTYAPYNNYSRVAYPIAYPSEAFPFIGPVHPFPKAPLGWRSVTLSFDDGHWWLKSHAQKHDWWLLRYW